MNQQPCSRGSDLSLYRVSAIVSAYDSEAFLEGCLTDLTGQSLYECGELEIIVIDSGSTQDEGGIVRRFQQDHPHIVYERTGERETLYRAWNRGAAKARGSYLTNANTDDRHRPDAFETLAAALDANPHVGMVYADCLITDTPHETFERNSARSAYVFPPCSLRQALARQFFGPQPMWRRTVHLALGGFNPDFVVQGDYDFFIRLAHGFGGLHVPEFLGLYCRRPDSVERANRDLNIQEQHLIKSGTRGNTPLDDIYSALALYPGNDLARGA